MSGDALAQIQAWPRDDSQSAMGRRMVFRPSLTTVPLEAAPASQQPALADRPLPAVRPRRIQIDVSVTLKRRFVRLFEEFSC